MKYTLDNGKSVNIPKSEIEKLMSSLELSEKDAIDLWLCDHDYEEDEEQTELDEKASKVKISHEIAQKKEKKERKPPKKVVSSEKQTLFNEILTNLTENYGENVKILTENKLISIEINGITFKIDIIQQRPPKQ
jgi:ParB-like chromosome segregation protein Spo0J